MSMLFSLRRRTQKPNDLLNLAVKVMDSQRGAIGNVKDHLRNNILGNSFDDICLTQEKK